MERRPCPRRGSGRRPGAIPSSSLFLAIARHGVDVWTSWTFGHIQASNTSGARRSRGVTVEVGLFVASWPSKIRLTSLVLCKHQHELDKIRYGKSPRQYDAMSEKIDAPPIVTVAVLESSRLKQLVSSQRTFFLHHGALSLVTDERGRELLEVSRNPGGRHDAARQQPGTAVSTVTQQHSSCF